MKEPYWEKMMREKFSFLYPSERVAADIGKGVVIGLLMVVAGLLLIDIGISFIYHVYFSLINLSIVDTARKTIVFYR